MMEIEINELTKLIRQLTTGETPRLLVCGDVMLDEYVWGRVDRVSPEAPVLILRANEQEARLGGAASVAGLLRGLGAQVELAGVVGDDAEGRAVRRLAEDALIGTGGLLVDPNRETSAKRRFLGRAEQRHPQQMLRVDRESAGEIGRDTAEDLMRWIAAQIPTSAAVLLPDYGKGVLSPSLLGPVLAASADQGVPVAVDPARGVAWDRYAGATLIKPNRRELELVAPASFRTVDDIIETAGALRTRHACRNVVVTLDRDGLILADERGAEHLPTCPRDVYDATGAGDMALAALGYGLARGIGPRRMGPLVNQLAGLEVECWGVAPISWNDLLRELGPVHDKVVSLTELTTRVDSARRQRRSIVLTNGCFDLLHEGHVQCLRGAAACGDVLVVAVNSDESVRRLKGPGRPILTQNERAGVLAALADVDYVTVFDDATPHRLLEQLRPDVLVKGGTYTVDQVVGREIVASYGGQVRVVPSMAHRSTTSIIQRCVAQWPGSAPDMASASASSRETGNLNVKS